ncbi:cell division ATP-binding protein FtsE [Campylobacter sp. MG1]|uniref:cell division ATP-binding protein FtsE n=1 Tax=Campylobacter sp. MG1 TaxID=2976332 RepID=UPI00226D3EBC|nr:ATP-binding cassette domain-containing protein [Campylobacter sp. MG1]
MNSANVLNASNLTIAYNKEIVINNVNFSAYEGDFIFITGKSGSGKTTLLKSFFGEISDFDGNLHVLFKNMHNINNVELLKLRRKLGIIFQDYKLINELNVIENIALPLRIAGYKNEQIMNQVDILLKYIKLQHKAKKMPLELSGGEQQRIALARAIIHNPKIIICDEPTGNLDSHSADIIWQILNNGARNTFNSCIIVATHQIPKKIDFSYRHFQLESGELHEFA